MSATWQPPACAAADPEFHRFVGVASYFDLAVSPDGSTVACVGNASGSKALSLHPLTPDLREAAPQFLPSGVGLAPDRACWSPDQRWLLVAADRGGTEQYELHAVDVADGSWRALACAAGVRHELGASPFSPDGQRIAFGSNARSDTDFDVVVMDLRTRAARTLVATGDWLVPVSWSPDGRHLLCIAGEVGQPWDLFAWSEGDGWVNLTNTPDVWELWPTFSPDGRWISYIADSRVQVRPFLRAGPAIQVSSTRSRAPLWSPDGSELYYQSEVEEPAAATGDGASGTTETQNWVMAAAVTYSDSGIDIGRPERLFRADGYVSVIPIRSWDMGPDGRFLMSMSSSDESVRSAIDKFFPRRVRLIQNWASTLEEPVP